MKLTIEIELQWSSKLHEVMCSWPWKQIHFSANFATSSLSLRRSLSILATIPPEKLMSPMNAARPGPVRTSAMSDSVPVSQGPWEMEQVNAVVIYDFISWVCKHFVCKGWSERCDAFVLCANQNACSDATWAQARINLGLLWWWVSTFYRATHQS